MRKEFPCVESSIKISHRVTESTEKIIGPNGGSVDLRVRCRSYRNHTAEFQIYFLFAVSIRPLRASTAYSTNEVHFLFKLSNFCF
jgi:hypothetical protein